MTALNNQKSCLSLIQQVQVELGLNPISSINFNARGLINDPVNQQITAIFTQAGQELTQELDWQILHRPFTIELKFYNFLASTVRLSDGSFDLTSIEVYDDSSGVNNTLADFKKLVDTRTLTQYNVAGNGSALTPPQVPTSSTEVQFFTSNNFAQWTPCSYYVNINGTYAPNLFRTTPPANAVFGWIQNDAGAWVRQPTQIQLTWNRIPLPADFETITDNTAWDSTRRWRLEGPLNYTEFQFLVNGWIAVSPIIRYTIFNNYFTIYPNYANREILTFMYKSNGWIWSTIDGVIQNDSYGFPIVTDTPAQDSDICLFPQRLIVSLMKYKYFTIKGMDDTSVRQEYMRELTVYKAKDKGARILSYSPKEAYTLLSWMNIQDVGFESFGTGSNSLP